MLSLGGNRTFKRWGQAGSHQVTNEMPLQRTLGSSFSLFHFSAIEWAVLVSTTHSQVCWLAQSASIGMNQLGKEINYAKEPPQS